jgi:hypothetical protein
MATTGGGQSIELDAKFLEHNEKAGCVRVWLFDAQKVASFVSSVEQLGQWKTAIAGDRIKVRLPQRYADENQLLGEQTWGTGAGRASGAKPVPGTGGMLNG